MRMMQWILAGCAAICFTSPAYAVSVKNLSGSTQVVTVEQGGATRNVTIENGGMFRYHGADVVLMMPGQRPKQTDFTEEYVIWPDGRLTIQRINKPKGASR